MVKFLQYDIKENANNINDTYFRFSEIVKKSVFTGNFKSRASTNLLLTLSPIDNFLSKLPKREVDTNNLIDDKFSANQYIASSRIDL